jgi:hypothetical protein
LREDDRHIRPPPQHIGDYGLVARVKVLDYKYRNREPGGQAAEHMPQSGDAARRCGDGHDSVWLAGPGLG